MVTVTFLGVVHFVKALATNKDEVECTSSAAYTFPQPCKRDNQCIQEHTKLFKVHVSRCGMNFPEVEEPCVQCNIYRAVRNELGSSPGRLRYLLIQMRIVLLIPV